MAAQRSSHGPPYARLAPLPVLLSAVAATLGGCDEGPLIDGLFSDAEWRVIEELSPLPTVPDDPSNAYADDPRAAKLGQALFFERVHSGPLTVGVASEQGGLGPVGATGRVACADCHMPEHGYHDERSSPNATSLGVGWTARNTPSLVNAAFYEWYSWSGAADSLWLEAIGATFKPTFQASSRLTVAHLLAGPYRADYEDVFGPIDPRYDPDQGIPEQGDPGDPEYDDLSDDVKFAIDGMIADFGKAIAAYVRLLVVRDTPFDRYVAGDFEAIGLSAKRGLKLFIGKAGCVECHDTPLLSDNEFHNVGIPQGCTPAGECDEGRAAALAALLADDTFATWGPHSDSDRRMGDLLDDLEPDQDTRGQFRTKSLRGAATSAPYMHNGAFDTLEDVIRHYDDGGADAGYPGTQDEHLAPLDLSEREVADLVSFLETLVGDPVAEELRTAPQRDDG